MLVLVDMLKGIVLIFRNTPAAPVASDSMISRAALAAFNMINDRWTSCADGTALLSFQRCLRGAIRAACPPVIDNLNLIIC